MVNELSTWPFVLIMAGEMKKKKRGKKKVKTRYGLWWLGWTYNNIIVQAIV